MKTVSLIEQTHKSLKIFAAHQGLAMSTSVSLLLAFWDKNMQGQTLETGNIPPASPQAPAVEGETEPPAGDGEQQPNHYVYA